ncbi:TATA-binding protein-associated factor 172-like [Palaemon carinicauda]|uniref:TATA-binding protein-associated factor 172-like n=1 Tax=Palaemon carinicauda TaxID=392227 RepID=UPI0035B69CFD
MYNNSLDVPRPKRLTTLQSCTYDRQHLPGVTDLRLDGLVPAGSRHALVQRFNDLLLLTTQVGGLGLNLTGADTILGL